MSSTGYPVSELHSKHVLTCSDVQTSTRQVYTRGLHVVRLIPDTSHIVAHKQDQPYLNSP
jgi:hypothetical protein